ncbi:branched-chain amino acid transporter permease [Corynebacterium caspium]|uniref:branched-chain amino acid transporter permease n=1 Tax=Corynebacterium caspium TaxID=234828 RepID=UPI00036A2A28|nr:AzlD domain-containing protein [Corynebacterium caspium]WKD60051.1 Branched-chain amino acid transport protein (AzlD) [Corynebacterium caspium DSM 44850]
MILASSYGLPEGVTLTQVAIVIIPVAIITVLLRWLPFIFYRLLSRSAFVGTLGATMPLGVMTVLVVYAMRGEAASPGGIWAVLAGVIFTSVLHWWRHNTVLSILGGTVFYMVLVNVVL